MYFLLQIEFLYANLCEYFEANMKRMMRVNGYCEYTETYEYCAVRTRPYPHVLSFSNISSMVLTPVR
jgi:hypothetical protein